MSFSKPNVSAATQTRSRVATSQSGMCVVCLDGCTGLCEVGKSAIKGREAIYPQPFGKIIAGAEKDYPVDYSHFNIQGTIIGAQGVAADSDKALFSNVDISTEIGAKDKIKMRVPFFTGALGSTEIARVHWEGMAIGAAISGTVIVVGENVCGIDGDAEFRNGKVVRSPEMERRIRIYKQWHQDGEGEIIVQYNVEDGRMGVPEYVVEKLGVKVIEAKWGQGAKDIGGEVKLWSVERAIQLKERGYVVLPDPTSIYNQQAFKAGAITEFERHSRLGMVDEDSYIEDFIDEMAHLRKAGAKYVTLKTGAYRPADLARAVKCASEAKIDLLTVDGSGGGTGMSPWRMMNEWGVPTVYIESMLYNYLSRLDKKGKFIPSCAIAGGIALEDQIFKGLALGAPYIKAICMGRASQAAAMVGNTVGKKAVTYVIFLVYPTIHAGERRRNIDATLPYAINYITAMSTAGITPAEVFKLLGESPIYGESAVEAKYIVREIEIFGKDLTDAIRIVSSVTPSDRMKEFLQGAVAAISAGTNLTDYYRNKAAQYTIENRQQQKIFLDTLGLIAESYVTALVAGTLFLIILQSIMSIISGEVSPMFLYVVIYLIVPFGSIMFVILISSMTPEV